MKHKIALTLTFFILSIGLSVSASAQSGRLFKGVNWKQRVEDARNGNAKIDKESLARVNEAYAERKEIDAAAAAGAVVPEQADGNLVYDRSGTDARRYFLCLSHLRRGRRNGRNVQPVGSFDRRTVARRL